MKVYRSTENFSSYLEKYINNTNLCLSADFTSDENFQKRQLLDVKFHGELSRIDDENQNLELSFPFYLKLFKKIPSFNSIRLTIRFIDKFIYDSEKDDWNDDYDHINNLSKKLIETIHNSGIKRRNASINFLCRH